jgi:hypothetical protein
MKYFLLLWAAFIFAEVYELNQVYHIRLELRNGQGALVTDEMINQDQIRAMCASGGEIPGYDPCYPGWIYTTQDTTFKPNVPDSVFQGYTTDSYRIGDTLFFEYSISPDDFQIKRLLIDGDTLFDAEFENQCWGASCAGSGIGSITLGEIDTLINNPSLNGNDSAFYDFYIFYFIKSGIAVENVSEPTDRGPFVVYPVPFSSNLFIKCPRKYSGTKFEVDLLDMNGRRVQRFMGKNGSFYMNVRALCGGRLAPGTYLIRIKSEDRSIEFYKKIQRIND